MSKTGISNRPISPNFTPPPTSFERSKVTQQTVAWRIAASLGRQLSVGKGGVLATRQQVVVVVAVHPHGQSDLPELAQALNRAGAALRPAKGRQEQAGERGDDRDHHQQLDQGEARQDPRPSEKCPLAGGTVAGPTPAG